MSRPLILCEPEFLVQLYHCLFQASSQDTPKFSSFYTLKTMRLFPDFVENKEFLPFIKDNT